MSTTTSQTPHAPGGAFTRTSSGLVRQVSTMDTFWYGAMQSGFAYVVFIIAAWSLYPGASMELGTAILLVGSVSVGLTYALFSAVYPRSGGEYVFLSRTFHASIGFVASFMVAFWQAFYFGINGAFLSIYGIAPTLQTLGLQQNSQTLLDAGDFFTKGAGIFLTGTVVIVLFGAIQYQGLRAYFQIQKWGGLLALGSAVVCLIVLALGATGALDFKAHFNDIAGSSNAYDGVIASARKAGTDVSPAFSLDKTLQFMIWPAFSLLFAILSTSFSGEIKNVRRGQLWGITGAMVFSGLMMILFMALSRGAVGSEFLRAASATDDFPLATSPFINVFAAITADNVVITLLLNVFIWIIFAFVAATTLLYASRAILAWGIDGMGPEKLSAVGRHHTPGVAILISAVVAELCLAVYAFTDLLVVLSGLAGMAIAFLLTCLAGALFPFLKRDAFESSPAAMRLLGVPLITVTGAVASVCLAYLIYRAFADKGYGATTTTSIVANIGVVVIAVVWFLVARWYRARHGVDLKRRFAEIPVE